MREWRSEVSGWLGWYLVVSKGKRMAVDHAEIGDVCMVPFFSTRILPNL